MVGKTTPLNTESKEVNSGGTFVIEVKGSLQAESSEPSPEQMIRLQRAGIAGLLALGFGLLAVAVAAFCFAVFGSESIIGNTIKGYVYACLALAAIFLGMAVCCGAVGYGASYLCISNDPDAPGCCGNDEAPSESRTPTYGHRFAYLTEK